MQELYDSEEHFIDHITKLLHELKSSNFLKNQDAINNIFNYNLISVNNEKNTVISHLFKSNNQNICELLEILFECGYNVNTKCSVYNNPLLLLCAQGYDNSYNKIQLLLKYKIDINYLESGYNAVELYVNNNTINKNFDIITLLFDANLTIKPLSMSKILNNYILNNKQIFYELFTKYKIFRTWMNNDHIADLIVHCANIKSFDIFTKSFDLNITNFSISDVPRIIAIYPNNKQTIDRIVKNILKMSQFSHLVELMELLNKHYRVEYIQNDIFEYISNMKYNDTKLAMTKILLPHYDKNKTSPVSIIDTLLKNTQNDCNYVIVKFIIEYYKINQFTVSHNTFVNFIKTNDYNVENQIFKYFETVNIKDYITEFLCGHIIFQPQIISIIPQLLTSLEKKVRKVVLAKPITYTSYEYQRSHHVYCILLANCKVSSVLLESGVHGQNVSSSRITSYNKFKNYHKNIKKICGKYIIHGVVGNSDNAFNTTYRNNLKIIETCLIMIKYNMISKALSCVTKYNILPFVLEY